MSFLPGRLAATEGAYFLEESKRAAGRLAKNLPPQSSSNSSKTPDLNLEQNPDVLPEILRHSIPIKAVAPEADASISTATKWNLDKGGNSAKKISRDALNPLSAYVSMPQATFGPKRWQLPSEQPVITASTANDLRQDKYSHVDSRKLKALASGYTQIGKAFFIATMIVFGGAASVFVYTARKLQLESNDERIDHEGWRRSKMERQKKDLVWSKLDGSVPIRSIKLWIWASFWFYYGSTCILRKRQVLKMWDGSIPIDRCRSIEVIILSLMNET